MVLLQETKKVFFQRRLFWVGVLFQTNLQIFSNTGQVFFHGDTHWNGNEISQVMLQSGLRLGPEPGLRDLSRAALPIPLVSKITGERTTPAETTTSLEQDLKLRA